jgi:tripartite-type tricarboxylate transporter receptor subunit TctC
MTAMWKRTVLTAAAALMVSTAVARAEFPEKPVEMTVLFGGNAQTIGQLLADLMSKELPQPVVAVSRTGGGGAIGYTHVNSTEPDGYNIVWNSNSISSNYHQGNLPFNYEAFTPIARVSVEVPALAVRADTGWETLSDMVEAVKSGDTKLKVGDSGQGSFTHLTSVAVLEALGINDDAIYVPYGDGKAPVELLAGRIDAAVQWPGQFVQHHEEGTLRILCVTGAERIALLPRHRPAPRLAPKASILPCGAASRPPPARPKRSWRNWKRRPGQRARRRNSRRQPRTSGSRSRSWTRASSVS